MSGDYGNVKNTKIETVDSPLKKQIKLVPSQYLTSITSQSFRRKLHERTIHINCFFMLYISIS